MKPAGLFAGGEVLGCLGVTLAALVPAACNGTEPSGPTALQAPSITVSISPTVAAVPAASTARLTANVADHARNGGVKMPPDFSASHCGKIAPAPRPPRAGAP